MKRAQKIRRLKATDGFTLIEMLAALALAAILLYILFQVFATTSRAMSISNARSEIHANTRAILRIMHQEISGAFLDTSQDADADTPPDADYFVITDATPGDAVQFLTASALGTDGALSEVAYWLDTTDAQHPTLRRRLASDPANYDSDPGTDYTTFDASDTGHKVLDMDDNGTIDPNELPTTDAAKLATILGENVLAFNVEYYVSDMGLISARTATDLTDDSKSWSVDQWVDMTVFAGEQTRRVLSNTSDTLTVTPAWATLPDVGTQYEVGGFEGGSYTAQERHLTPAVRITLRVRDRRRRLPEGEDFVEIIAIKGKE